MRPLAAAAAATTAMCLMGLAACSGEPGQPAGSAPASPPWESATARDDPADIAPAEGDDGEGDDAKGDEADSPAGDEPASPAAGSDPRPVAAALVLAPEDAPWVTLTDWARIKDRLGAADLTSESIQTDRIEFWRALTSSTVLLTDGALREENSRLGIRYAVTQDDVLWEVRWAADDGATPGSARRVQRLALRLRDDLDLSGLQRAVVDEVSGLEDAEVLPDQRLLLRGAVEGAGLGAAPAVMAVLASEAETQLAAPGCLGWSTALGVDATVQDQEALADTASLQDLVDTEAWGMAFTGRQARVTVVYPEGTSREAAERDAEVRLGLAEEWPTTEPVGWGDAFGLPPGLSGAGFVVDDAGVRVVAAADYRVVNPTAAATVALAGLVPWAVCSELDWLAEPTGL